MTPPKSVLFQKFTKTVDMWGTEPELELCNAQIEIQEGDLRVLDRDGHGLAGPSAVQGEAINERGVGSTLPVLLQDADGLDGVNVVPNVVDGLHAGDRNQERSVKNAREDREADLATMALRKNTTIANVLIFRASVFGKVFK